MSQLLFKWMLMYGISICLTFEFSLFLLSSLPPPPTSPSTYFMQKKIHNTDTCFTQYDMMCVVPKTKRRTQTTNTFNLTWLGWICKHPHDSFARIVPINSQTWNVNQVRVVFLYWLPAILRMHRPGSDNAMNYPPTPTSDASERKTTNIQDVELRERYEFGRRSKII